MFEPVISLATAKTILSSRMQKLTDALSQCQQVWNTVFASAQMTLDGSARAQVINQYWYANARAIFKDDRGVAFTNDQLQRYLIIDERIILRFKLLDNHLRTSNYPTEHALNWPSQMPLEGLPPCGRLHYGYRMDVTGTKIKDAFIILPNSICNEWIWQTSGEPIDTFDTYGFQVPLSSQNISKSLVYQYDNYPLGD